MISITHLAYCIPLTSRESKDVGSIVEIDNNYILSVGKELAIVDRVVGGSVVETFIKQACQRAGLSRRGLHLCINYLRPVGSLAKFHAFRRTFSQTYIDPKEHCLLRLAGLRLGPNIQLQAILAVGCVCSKNLVENLDAIDAELNIAGVWIDGGVRDVSQACSLQSDHLLVNEDCPGLEGEGFSQEKSNL